MRFAVLLPLALAACGEPVPPPDVDVRPTLEGLSLTSREPLAYSACEWSLNGDYDLLANIPVEPGEVVVPWGGFVTGGGERFSFPATAVRSLHVHCSKPKTLTIYTEFG